MTTLVAGYRPSVEHAMDVHVTGRRIVATLIDGLVFGATYIALAASFGTITRNPDEAFDWTASTPVAVSVGYALFVVVYYLLLEGYRGQTLGKMAMGVTVVDETTGASPGLPAIAIRTVLRLVDGILGYLIAFVAALASQKRQRLGDMAAHTLVVRKEA